MSSQTEEEVHMLWTSQKRKYVNKIKAKYSDRLFVATGVAFLHGAVSEEPLANAVAVRSSPAHIVFLVL